MLTNCRSSASLLQLPFFKKQATEVLEATKQAGRELIQFKKVTPETLERITRPLIDAPTFAKMGLIPRKSS